MIKFKKILRILGLTILILMALSGVGIIGVLFSNNRERYQDKKITVEMVDKKKNETASQTDQIRAQE